ncbi:M28 family metallopeptidase [Mycolicibacterium sp. 018/SC-01/001]|uniref:M28 family metallopeptidase n=1 Tax=Mycolicibacterium sp. 018/SC-01/001 TaxID=2592069 RepID=UPI0021032857|nr:M28 family metallopeptidase [Mycolicibacterium sp. 018/SC-01/001]
MTLTRSRLAVLLAVALLVGGGCTRGNQSAPAQSSPSPSVDAGAAGQFADTLAKKVTVDATMAHLQALQDIANANGGNRALGTRGYDASVDYVAKALRDKGFDVQTPEFDVRLPWADAPNLTVGGAQVTARPLQYTVGAPGAGVSGPIVAARVEDSPGCTAQDYDGLPTQGAVVVVDRGSCPFGEKQTAAVARGAVGLIVVNNADGEVDGGTLGEDTDVKIPVITVAKAEGPRLRAAAGDPATIRMNAGVRQEKTRNVIAQTKTGSTADVVMVGSHLDSVPEGPGINDNGSGSAAVLETALQLGPSPQVANAVRFAFWGAEEEGLLGSYDYVNSLNVDQLKDIALYLNFDMLGSPNPGYFTYDGDQSTGVGNQPVPRVPEGSAGIERALVGYLDRAGKKGEDTSFDGRSDYDAFTRAGVPSGGLFSGAEEKKDARQAQLWGGQADQPFDPNYHKATDTVDRIDRTAMGINGSGVGWAVGYYAQDQRGRTGIPQRDDRTRHTLRES